MRIRPIACVIVMAVATPALLAAEEPGASQAASAGMRAYVDPATGALLPQPPVGARQALRPETAVDTSAADLMEEAAPGGGVMVNLQGRFHSHMTATVQPDGSVTTSCRTGTTPLTTAP